ncbi:uncharacterized protein LOC126455990 [Schistocerca serialis cubense]|uniref:uncharacterized protein LOC126455990 n=1 Tax=Schistocerca serialis cubense TaxID=2023355 RepID=UPI00214E47E5|nr:uncharacterized protein LOC126455990 [Schistocerca serialis cubense]
MLVALFVFATAAAAPLSARGPAAHGEHQPLPTRGTAQPHGEDTVGDVDVVTTPTSPSATGADHSVPDLETITEQHGADLCEGSWHRPHPTVGEGEVNEFKKIPKLYTTSSVFFGFVGSLRTRRSSETPLSTRDKSLNPTQTPASTGVDVETSFGVSQNVHLSSEKELSPRKASPNSSKLPLEDSVSAISEEGLSSPTPNIEEKRDRQPKTMSTTEKLSSRVISSTHHWMTTPRDVGSAAADTPVLSRLSRFQKAELNSSAASVADGNITHTYIVYQSSGGSNGESQNTGERLDFSGSKSAYSSSGNGDNTVVEVEISKPDMAATEKETEEIIIRDATLIIVFSCLAVLVLVVCKIIRYVMDYKLSKYEERMQNAGVRPCC